MNDKERLIDLMERALSDSNDLLNRIEDCQKLAATIDRLNLSEHLGEQCRQVHHTNQRLRMILECLQ